MQNKIDILAIGKEFHKYTIGLLVSNKYPYRSVYAGNDRSGNDIVLITYDMELYHGPTFRQKKADMPLEMKIIKKAKGICGKVLASGYDQEKHMSWMAIDDSPYSNKLPRFIKRQTEDYERKQLISKVVDSYLKFRAYCPGYAICNIQPDNILIEYKGGDYSVRFVGLGQVNNTLHPINLWFDEEYIDPFFAAPEMMERRPSTTTDYYSLSLVLNTIVHNQLPWYFNIKKGVNHSELIKISKRTRTKDNLIESKTITPVVEALNEPNMRPMYFTLDDLAEELYPNCEEPSDEEEEPRERPRTRPAKETEAKVAIETKQGEGFKAVAGMEGLKADLKSSVIDVLSNRELAQTFGITPPNGMLLYGPPGCGKTFIASRLAEEAGVKISFVRPSDLGSIYIHGSQSMISDLFKKAEANAPTMLIFDEIDALVPNRSTMNGNQSQAGEVNEFLTQLESCSSRGIFVVGTTNRIDNIDPAVLRTGRIEEMVYVPMPDKDNRIALFKLELSKRPCAEGIDYERLAGLSERFTMSDISYAVNKASRTLFQQAIEGTNPKDCKITMALMEEIVSKMNPSITEKMALEYEEMRKQFRNNSEQTHPNKIGFDFGRTA